MSGRHDAEVLVVTTPGCPNCRAMEPLVDAATQDHAESVTVVAVDASADLDRARDLGVRGVPTFIARPDGADVSRRIGRLSSDEPGERHEPPEPIVGCASAPLQRSPLSASSRPRFRCSASPR